MNPQPKVKPWRSEKYRRWVASLACCVCGYRDCNAHHHQEDGHGTMSGKCCDSRCIPLCVRCHAKVHQIGSKSFWMHSWVDGESHVQVTRNRWEFEKGGRPWE